MKKRYIRFLCVGCLLACILVLSSCSFIANLLDGIDNIQNATPSDQEIIDCDHNNLSGWKCNDVAHYRTCNDCKAQLDSGAHSFEETIIDKADCEKNGTIQYTCKDCDYSYLDVIESKGHQYGEWTTVTPATADTDGLEKHVCTVCQHEETRKIDKLSLLKELPKDQYYGYQYLVSTKNQYYLDIYNLLVQGVENYQKVIDIPHDKEHLSKDELKMIFDIYRADYPQHFYIENGYTYSYIELKGYVTSITLTYVSDDHATLDKMQSDFNASVETYLTGISGLMSDYEKELMVHERIVLGAQYDSTLNKTYTHTAYANLVLGYSVCDGYAEAFQYLMYKCGIQAITVSGVAKSENHAWNIVRIDGKYYQMDVTWDDPVGQTADATSHEYFNVTTEYMNVDHNISCPSYTMPACNSTENNYFVKSNKTGNLTFQDVSKVIKNTINDSKDYTVEMLVVGGATHDELVDFVQKNINALCICCEQAIGKNVTSLKYSLSSSGRLIVLTPVIG